MPKWLRWVLIVVAAVIVLYVLGVVLFGTGGVEPGPS